MAPTSFYTASIPSLGYPRMTLSQVEDATTSDNIFATRMGELVALRRHFIESNARRVRKVDI